MKVQPWVRASVEDLEDLRQDVHMAPLNGADTICTNECGPGRTLEMEGSSCRVLVYTTTSLSTGRANLLEKDYDRFIVIPLFS